MKTFKQHLSEDNVATLKKIVSNKQNMPLKMKDGSMKVDLFTASAFVKGMEKKLPQIKKERMFLLMLEGIHPRDAQVVVNMINKKTPKGLTRAIVEETFPGLLQG